MKLKLICIGKTDDKALQQLITNYVNRLQHYIKFEVLELQDIKNSKNLTEGQQKEKEGDIVIKHLDDSDFVVLFDENGQQFSSVGFSKLFQKRMNSGIKQLVFIVGGPYGFSEKAIGRSNQKISLSNMTFSHQMVRLFAVEQFYRAFTILRNEPYHHR